MPEPTIQTRSSPIPYSPEVERPEADEQETIRELIETLRSIAEKTFEDRGHGIRSVHAKSHGLLVGDLSIEPDLPPELAQGLFATSGRYPVVMRFSTTPGDMLDDSVSLPRGLAIKVLGVTGERVDGAAGQSTQDFVMVNGPAFLKPDAKSFLRSLKLLAKTTDHAEPLKKAFSAVLRGTEKVIEAFGGESATLKSMGGHPETHILGETFFTQVPLRFGDYMAKLSIAPVSPSLAALTDAKLNVNGKPDGLRDAIVAFFASQDGQWELRAQLCSDLEDMPIEDASVVWPEEKSAYRTVARISAPTQTAWSEERSRVIDDLLSFSPWHALAAHQPLGSVMRARKAAYQTMAEFRARQNGVTLLEPRSLADLGLHDVDTSIELSKTPERTA